MSIALSPAPAAKMASPASANPQPAAGGPSIAAGGAAEIDANTPGFQQALQRITLAGLAPANGETDAILAVQSADDTTATDANADVTAGQGSHLFDLMLSGMLLPPVALPVAAPDTGMPTTESSAAIGLPSISARDDAIGAAPVDTAIDAHAPVLSAPLTLPALGADTTPAVALASVPTARFVLPKTSFDTADTTEQPPTIAGASARPAGPTSLASLTLAAPTVAADNGAARDHRNLASSNLSAMDAQGLDPASTAVASIDTSARTASSPANSTSQAVSSKPQSLIESLGDRIALQLQRGSERAVIRLDPPMQGQLEITIRHDATGATQIHLSASNSDVVRQLQTLSDSLRQELVHRQPGEVTVVVTHSGRDQDGRQRQNKQAVQEEPGRALADTGDTQSPARFTLSPT